MRLSMTETWNEEGGTEGDRRGLWEMMSLITYKNTSTGSSCQNGNSIRPDRITGQIRRYRACGARTVPGESTWQRPARPAKTLACGRRGGTQGWGVGSRRQDRNNILKPGFWAGRSCGHETGFRVSGELWSRNRSPILAGRFRKSACLALGG